jgi:hypothetical protein
MFSASTITPQEVILTILYSIAGLGIAIVNDFKSIEGDAALGMNSLPVAFGVDTAKWICVASIDVTQLGVAAYLYAIGETTYAAILFGLVLPQMFAQYTFVQVRTAAFAPPLHATPAGSGGLFACNWGDHLRRHSDWAGTAPNVLPLSFRRSPIPPLHCRRILWLTTSSTKPPPSPSLSSASSAQQSQSGTTPSSQRLEPLNRCILMLASQAGRSHLFIDSWRAFRFSPAAKAFFRVTTSRTRGPFARPSVNCGTCVRARAREA